MKKKFLLLINLVALLFAWQISHIKQVSADDKIDVVTTFYPVYEFTKAVTGDTADVTMLIKAGTEPHDFEPSTKILQRFQTLMFLSIWTIVWKHGLIALKNPLVQTV